MTLEDFYAAGAYIVAGHLDLPGNGTGRPVVRLAQITTGGDLILTPEGEKFVAEQMADTNPGAVELAVVEPPKRGRKPKKEAEAPAEPPSDLQSLDEMLNS